MQFTGNQIRNELKLCERAFSLKERFIKGDDPTMVLGKAIEDIQLHLSNLQDLYNKGGQDRNAIVHEAKTQLNSIQSICSEAVSFMGSSGEPEDTNRSI